MTRDERIEAYTAEGCALIVDLMLAGEAQRADDMFLDLWETRLRYLSPLSDPHEPA